MVSCLNKMGSKSAVLNDLTCTLWKWCTERKLWLSAAHIPGVANVEADKLSCDLHLNTERKLNSQLLKEMLTVLETQPTVDLFASRTNAQFPLYVSYLPDPGVYTVDAFSLHWGDLTFYCFPPFSILPRVLRKIREERVTGTVVAPLWKNPAFWLMLMNMLTARPVPLPAREELLSQPCNKNLKHPLRKKLALLVCKCHGQIQKSRTFWGRNWVRHVILARIHSTNVWCLHQTVCAVCTWKESGSVFTASDHCHKLPSPVSETWSFLQCRVHSTLTTQQLSLYRWQGGIWM